ncbi:hypothetical protein BGZ94_004873, partial [Podila epigama]
MSPELNPRLAEAIESLKSDPTLTTLDLSSSPINDRVADLLAETLMTNPCLTTLVLEECRISTNGAQALGEALKTNSALS